MPDFFGDEYYEKARSALKRVDGMALPEFLGGRVFNMLFREVFADELELRSHEMVDEVKEYMQSILQKLFEDACRAYPALLNNVKTSLVDEFLELKAEKAMEAVSNVVNAELGWLFTQDRAHTTLIANVRDMVRKVRQSETAATAVAEAGGRRVPDNATAVGEVPEAFIKTMVASKEAQDQDIRILQVGVPLACVQLYYRVLFQLHTHQTHSTWYCFAREKDT